MKFSLRSASGVALLAGLAGSLPAWAQQAQVAVQETVNVTQVSGPQVAASGPQVQQTPAAGPQAPAPATEPEKVIVTGSYIQGTAVDTALPVEVYSEKDLEKKGSPTNLEFAKSLSVSGPTSGEAYYFSGNIPGNVAYNLRGIGADKTLVLLNGLRLSANNVDVPQAALARTEILKDGAATIYGADAVGGVVNFITRDHFTGLEARTYYKDIDGSNGDYGASFLAGVGKGDTNLLFSGEWEHRSRLNTLDRPFSSQPYYVNPAPWSTLTNLATWEARGALPTTPSPFVTGTTTQDPSAEFGPLVAAGTGAFVKDFTPSSCAAVGGTYNPNGVTTGLPACAYGYANFYNLVEDQNVYRAYTQLNTRVTDNMNFHFEAAYGEINVPKSFGSPAQPVIRGPALDTGATNQFYVPAVANSEYAANPYAAAFLANSGLTGTALAATQGFTALTYRAFAHGGNNALGGGDGYGTPSKIDSQSWRVSGGLKGNLGDWAGVLKDVGYNFNVTYNELTTYADAPDVVGFRLQEALDGFGGPACNAVDLDPKRNGTQNPAAAGKNGCLFWNPFASNFPSQPNLNAANPAFNPAATNPVELERWIFDTRGSTSTAQNLNVDLVFNSQTPLHLWGGNVGVAFGTQVRELENKVSVPDPLYNGQTPCEWPTGEAPLTPASAQFNGCTPDSPGPFVFFGTVPNTSNDQQNYSFFIETEVPVYDKLNFQLAARHEEFSHGLDATVYKVSGKWDIWGPLSVRGAYGTNYQAPPPTLVPGQINNGVNSYTKVAGAWLGAQTVTQSNVVPSTAKTENIGLIWQSRGITQGSDFRFIVDWFSIKTANEIGLLASVNDIAATIFGFTTSNTGAALANCSSPLISRVTFNSGTCVQGVTTARDFSTIRTDFGNGPGRNTEGLDFQSTYTMHLGPGELSFDATATDITKFIVGAKTLDGNIVVDSATGAIGASDHLGKLNFATVAAATPRWRANAGANYAWDTMNFRLSADYISAVRDTRFDPLVAGCPQVPGYQNLSTAGGIGCTNYGYDGKDWLTFDFVWTWDIIDQIKMTLSVENLTDRSPPAAREELGYDPLEGNPLGRTYMLGLKKTF